MKLFPNWKQCKGKIAFLLASALMVTAMLPGLGVLQSKAAEDKEVVFTDDFEDGTGNWWNNNGSVVGVSSGDSAFMTISVEDTGYAKGATTDRKANITDGKYGYSFRAKSVSGGDVLVRPIAVWDSGYASQQTFATKEFDLTSDWAEYSGEMNITLDYSKDDATTGLHQFQFTLEPTLKDSTILVDDVKIWEEEVEELPDVPAKITLDVSNFFEAANLSQHAWDSMGTVENTQNPIEGTLSYDEWATISGEFVLKDGRTETKPSWFTQLRFTSGDSGAPFFVDNLVITKKGDATNVVATQDKNNSFENAASPGGTPYWWDGQWNNATQKQVNVDGITGKNPSIPDGSWAMEVNLTVPGTANGVTNNDVKFELETTYEYTFKVRLKDKTPAGTVQLSVNALYGENSYSNTDFFVAPQKLSKPLSEDEWVTVSGSFDLTDKSAEKGAAYWKTQLIFSSGASAKAFYVDDFVITEKGSTDNVALAGQGYNPTFEWASVAGGVPGWWDGQYNNAVTKQVTVGQITGNNPSIPEGTYAMEVVPSQGGDSVGACCSDVPLQVGKTYNYSFKARLKGLSIQNDIPRLWEAFKNKSSNPDAAAGFGYGGMAGVAMGPDALNDRNRMDLVKYHFNNITIENQFKQDTILPSYTPSAISDGNGGFFPTLDFGAPKPILDWVKEYNATNPATDDDIKIRGHVLVWHSQARDWFFKEGYTSGGAYVTPEVMNTRLEYYIKTVFEYLIDNGYADLFYGWDVVNEAISDGGDGYRKNGDWWGVYGSEEYIINAFRYANKYAPSNIKLFYNDYNDTTPSKVKDIVTLLNAVVAHENDAVNPTRIDGMGMQGHYDMVIPTANQFKEAAIAYQNAIGSDGEIHITELDMKATSGFNSGGDPAKLAAEDVKQGWHYAQVYNAIRELNAEGKANITNIVFWGTHDAISWLKTFNGVGGGGTGAEVYPLLFDDDFQAKPAYWAFVNQAKLSPNIQSVTVMESPDGSFAAANTYSFGNAAFAPIWNGTKLSVKVTVKDATNDATDKVTLFVDAGSIKSVSIARSAATATSDGYEAVLSMNIEGLKVLSAFKMDVAVTDGSSTVSFNDPKNEQAAKSDNYAQALCKPFTIIYKGTPTVDGASESAWDVAPVVPFTIKTDSPAASASAKLLWDANYLYVLATVVDPALDKSGADAANPHLQDSLEIFMDENNKKAESYEADDVQYRVNFDNEVTVNPTSWSADNYTTAVTKSGSGYVVEGAFKWTEITPADGTFIGLELQINDAAGGNRIGTVSWFDTTGNGYQNPSVFGTALLENVPAQPEPGQPAPSQPSRNDSDDDEDMNDSPETFLPKGEDGKPNMRAAVSAYSEVTLPNGSKAKVELKSLVSAIKQAAIDFAKTVTGSEPFAFVEVNVPGYTGGKITIKFNLYDIYAGDLIVVLHQKSDGTWESIIPDKIEDGAVTVTFSSLSPVVFSKLTPVGVIQSPKTYDNGVNPVVVPILIGFVCIGTCALVWVRKRKGSK